MAPEHRHDAQATPEDIIRSLASKHSIGAERTETDALADLITGLAGAQIVQDEVEDLIVAMQRKGVLTPDQARDLYGEYLASR